MKNLSGTLCVAITYICLGVGFYFFVYRLGWTWATTNWLIWWPTLDIGARLAMATFCHMYCVCCDPGFAVPQKDSSESACKKCFAFRSKLTHHCSVCNHCVDKMDHHCPWIDNCVGLNNQKAFILFLFYTASAAIEALLFISARLVTCPSPSHSFVLLGLRFILGSTRVEELLDGEADVVPFEQTCDLTIEFAVWGLVAAILAVVFAIFTSFIAVDQLQNIANNQSTIQLLKGEKGPKRTLQEAALDVMGSAPSLWWLCPKRYIESKKFV